MGTDYSKISMNWAVVVANQIVVYTSRENVEEGRWKIIAVNTVAADRLFYTSIVFYSTLRF